MRIAFTTETITGDIVTKFPASSKILKEHKIDFCCGGNRPIGEVLHEKGISEDFIEQLNALYETSLVEYEYNWDDLSESEIVDIILVKFHEPTYELFDELTPLMDKVVSVHGANQPHLIDIKQAFDETKEELLLHFRKEEVMLFPRIKLYQENKTNELKNCLVAMITQMELDHNAAGDLLRKLRETTNDYQVIDGACNTYRLTYLKLEELETLTHEHVHTENNILFRRFK